MIRLELKAKKFQIFETASDSDIEQFFSVLLKVDSLITRAHTTHKSIEKLTSLEDYISHCCLFRKDSLTIRKSGKANCSFCSPVFGCHRIFLQVGDTVPELTVCIKQYTCIKPVELFLVVSILMHLVLFCLLNLSIRKPLHYLKPHPSQSISAVHVVVFGYMYWLHLQLLFCHVYMLVYSAIML